MSKVVTSPVKRFPGTVTLADPLTYEQVFAWQDALDKAFQERQGNAEVMKMHAALIPGLKACIEGYGLGGGFDPARWPATPTGAASRLVSWLVEEVSKLFDEAEDDLNP